MTEFWLPYGKTEVVIRIDEANVAGVIDSKDKEGSEQPIEEIKKALMEPIGSKKLCDLAKPGEKVAIVVDDKTRPSPSNIMVPCLLEELKNSGINERDIVIIFGCGIHSMSLDDGFRLLGDYSKELRLIIHNSNANDLKYIGKTSLGTDIYINKEFFEADLKILTGDICFHYYAGYGGGRKSVLPGISGYNTIQQNHILLLDPNARTGNLNGNPVHSDMMEAAKISKVDFILNVVMNSKNKIVKAFSGALDKAFFEGVKLVDEIYKVPVKEKAEMIVVSPGGYPFDLDLYQSYKAIDSALNIIEENGVIILVAECTEGYGNKIFYDWMLRFKTLSNLSKEIKKNFVIGGHKAYLLSKALEKAKIILVSIMPDNYANEVFRLKTARSINYALRLGLKSISKNGRVLIMPHGSITFPILKQ